MNDVNTLGRSIYFKTIAIVMIIWFIHYVLLLLGIDDTPFATSNRNEWYSILTGPILHGNLAHLVGNTISLFVSVPLMLYLYKKDFWNMTILGYLASGAISYVYPQYTVGISGLIFAYLFYIILRGLGSKDEKRFFIALILLLIKGTLFFAITNLAQRGIAWYSHLGGAVAAFFYAMYRYRK